MENFGGSAAKLESREESGLESKVNWKLDQLKNNVMGLRERIEATAVAPFDKRTLQDQLAETHDSYVNELQWAGRYIGEAETLKEFIPAMGMAMPEERVKQVEKMLEVELENIAEIKKVLVDRLDGIMKTPVADSIMATGAAQMEAELKNRREA